MLLMVPASVGVSLPHSQQTFRAGPTNKSARAITAVIPLCAVPLTGQGDKQVGECCDIFFFLMVVVCFV